MLENQPKITILIVDDEPDLLELCQDAFEMEGHSVVACENALDALEALSHKSFDAIVSDSRMPQMSGEEFLDKAREILGDKLPPFFISSGAIDLDSSELNERGMTDLIAKPFDIEEMVSLVVEKATVTS